MKTKFTITVMCVMSFMAGCSTFEGISSRPEPSEPDKIVSDTMNVSNEYSKSDKPQPATPTSAKVK